MNPIYRLTKLFQIASPVNYIFNRVLYSFDGKSRPAKPQWARIVMYQEMMKMVNNLHPEKLNVLEISPGEIWQGVGFKSYESLRYPEFDICENALNRQFDLIIADQVFEHLLWPRRAGKHILEMLKPGGHFILSTPFLIRLHDCPVDCSRWTELGLKYLLADCGFELDRIQTGSWGSRACVKANLKLSGWAIKGHWRSLLNEPLFPVAVWAMAQK